MITQYDYFIILLINYVIDMRNFYLEFFANQVYFQAGSSWFKPIQTEPDLVGHHERLEGGEAGDRGQLQVGEGLDQNFIEAWPTYKH